MRPTSAKKQPNLQYSRKRPSTANKKKQKEDKDKIMNLSGQKEYYTTNENSSKKKKIVFCESAKKIAMIHAYQPKLLKQCLVTNTKTYKQFYYQNSGLCMISNLYTISFMAHFKSWRKNLQNQLNDILKKLLRFDPLIEIQEVNQALRELENFSDEMQSGTKAVSSQKQLTLSQQAGQLKQSFQNLSKFLQKLIQILKIFCETVKKLSTTLQLALQNRMDAKQAKKQIRQSYNNFCSICSQPVGKCQSHPDSSFINRAEFIIKNHLKQMFEESINVLRKVKELQNFKHKLNDVSGLEDKSDEQIMKVLNQTAKLIKQHQSYRPRILSQESKDNKFKQMNIKLDTKFNSIILDFLAKFKQKLEPILQKQFNQIKEQSAQKFINQRDNQNNGRFLLCLQKFKLLSTIFNKNSAPEINQRLSQMLSRESTKTIQQLSQIIQNLRDLSRQGQCNSRASFFQRVNQLEHSISDFKRRKDHICQLIRNCLIYKNEVRLHTEQPASSANNSQKIAKISAFTDQYLHELLKVPRKLKIQKCDRTQIEQQITKDDRAISLAVADNFEAIQHSVNNLNKLINDPLINRLIKPTSQIKKDGIYSFWIFKEFYQKMSRPENLQRQLTQDSLQKMIDFYQEYRSKCQNYNNFKDAKIFLQWMFQTAIMKRILNYTQPIEAAIQHPLNKSYITPQKQASQNIEPSKGNFTDRRQVLCYVINFSTKELNYVKKQSANQKYIQNVISRIDQLNARQDKYKLFSQSTKSGSLFPNGSLLQQWLKWEFSYAVDEILSHQRIKKYRREMLQIFSIHVKRLQQIMTGKYSHALGNTMISSCKAKISCIQEKLVPFCQQRQNTRDKLTNYLELGRSITSYMRQNNIFHIGIFFNNEDLYTLLIEGEPSSYKTYLQIFEKNVKLPQPLQKQNASDKFIEFDIIDQEMKKQVQKEEQKKQINSFIMQKKNKKQKQQIAFIMNEVENNLDQQIIEENQFILEMNSHIEDNSPDIKSKLPDKQTSKKQIDVKKQKNHFYYKVKQLQSLNFLKQCLKSMKIQPQFVKKSLLYSKLALAFEQKQPNAELVEHLSKIIRQLKSNNLMQIFNKSNKMSESQKIVQDLLDSIQSSESPVQKRKKKLEALEKVLSIIGYSLKYLHDEGPTGNKLILCTNKNESYVYPLLLNENPDAGVKQVLKDEEMTKIQKLFLKSLFTVPHLKNRNLDEIKKLVQSLQLDGNKQLKQNLYKYRGYGARNEKEVDQKINKYLSSKIKEVKITSINSIDFQSYQIFLQDYLNIVKFNGEQQKLQKLLLKSSNKYPLLYSQDMHSVKAALDGQKDGEYVYSIIPIRFTSSPYTERTNYQTTEIDMAKIVKQITEQELKNCESFQSQNILQLLNSGGSLQKSPSQKQKINIFEPETLQDYNIITNCLRVLREKQVISQRIVQLKRQNQSDQTIWNALGEKPAIILQGNQNSLGEVEQQANFMAAQSELAVFILEDGRIKRKIHSPVTLQKIHALLNKRSYKHRKILYKGSLIGLAQVSEQPRKILEKLFGIGKDQETKFNETREKDIQIQQMVFYVKITNKILGRFSSDIRVLDALSNFTIEIKSNQLIQKVSNLKAYIDKQIPISCSLPKNTITIRLIRSEQGKASECVNEANVKHYKYGNTYILRMFEKELLKRVQQLKQKLKVLDEQEQKKEKERLIEQKINVKLTVVDNLLVQQFVEDEQYSENQCIGNFSFAFSDNFDVDNI